MKSYITRLADQYKQATGLEKIDLELFRVWREERREIGEEYIKLLDELNITYDTPEHIEVGKGGFDSAFLPYQTRFLTKYTQTIDDKKNKIIDGTILVFEYEPLVYCSGTPSKITSLGNVKKLMTQNPYTCLELNNWEDIHNGSNIEILIGMYGKLSDNDKEEKIELLNHIKKLLVADYTSEYKETDENYFCLLASNPKTKIR